MKREKGMSFIGFLMVAIVVGFILLTGLKLAPLYLEFRSIKQSMDATAQQSDKSSVSEVRENLRKRLDINYVSGVKPSNFEIKKIDDSYKISTKYEVEKDFIGNVSLLVRFEYETK